MSLVRTLLPKMWVLSTLVSVSSYSSSALSLSRVLNQKTLYKFGKQPSNLFANPHGLCRVLYRVVKFVAFEKLSETILP
jgi:hypothetical protein